MNPHSKNQVLNQHLSRLEIEFILIDYGLCPDWSRAEHTRRRDCMYLILEGQGKITIDGEEFYPKKNDMVLLPKGARVSLYSENETCYNKYWCDFLARLDGQPLFNVIDFPHLVHLDDISHVKALFDRLDELHLKTDIASALMIKAAITELLSVFLNSNTEKMSNKFDVNEFVNSVAAFIQKNLNRKLSVNEIAKTTKYNEKYFIELFKNHFGMTPARYVKTMRLEQAKRELLYTDNSVSNISNRLGYSTVQKFSRDFKDYTGFTPTDFKRKFR
ncbi:helix-turn-helix domain-containing protein [Lachnospiraceae bacterium MD329]|nr:helix-turn-helix domain-containing protein [Lachnospiraceae bacterium MD329]